MPGIVALRDAISSHVVASLAAANLPALTDNKILLGRQYQMEHSAPPRIVFVPIRGDFPMKDEADRSQIQQGYTAEQLLRGQNTSIRTEKLTFEVRCWGVSSNNDPDYDYDYTQALYHQIIRTCEEIAKGAYSASGGDWTDSTYNAGQLVRDGREFVFKLTFDTPVLRFVIPLVQAPSDVAPEVTDELRLPTGQHEPGCE